MKMHRKVCLEQRLMILIPLSYLSYLCSHTSFPFSFSSSVSWFAANGNGFFNGSLQIRSKYYEFHVLISQKSSLHPCCRNRANFSCRRLPIAIFASRGVMLFVLKQKRSSCQYGMGDRLTP